MICFTVGYCASDSFLEQGSAANFGQLALAETGSVIMGLRPCELLPEFWSKSGGSHKMQAGCNTCNHLLRQLLSGHAKCVLTLSLGASQCIHVGEVSISQCRQARLYEPGEVEVKVRNTILVSVLKT